MTEALNILLVNDDEDFLKLAQDKGKKYGMNIETSTDPIHTSVTLPKNHFSHIGVDVRMQPMSGVEFVNLIKPVTSAKIFMMSEYDCVELEREARLAGIKDIIAKPRTAKGLGIDTFIEQLRKLTN